MIIDLFTWQFFFLFCRYNFYTFGHAVRELYSSRGSREGNNAFLEVRIMDQCNININKIFGATILYKSRSKQYLWSSDLIVWGIKVCPLTLSVTNRPSLNLVPRVLSYPSLDSGKWGWLSLTVLILCLHPKMLSSYSYVWTRLWNKVHLFLFCFHVYRMIKGFTGLKAMAHQTFCHSVLRRESLLRLLKFCWMRWPFWKNQPFMKWNRWNKYNI